MMTKARQAEALSDEVMKIARREAEARGIDLHRQNSWTCAIAGVLADRSLFQEAVEEVKRRIAAGES